MNAIGIHGRFRGELSSDPCRIERIKKVTEHFGNEIPIIANGGSLEIKKIDEAWDFAKKCGASSIMIARAAEWDPSIFAKTDLLIKDKIKFPTHTELVQEYLNLVI